MSWTLNPDPWLKHRLRRDVAQPIIPRESTVTPIEYPLTASQAWNQRLLLQEPTNDVAKESVPGRMEYTLDIHNKQWDHLCDTSQNPHPDTSGLNLQTILLALARRLDPQLKKRNKRVKEPDLFSEGSPNKLWAFIFQYQIYFCACEGEFQEDTKKIFFAISYLRGVALDYFEPFINEAETYQSFNFLEE